MSLFDQISNDIKAAMLARDKQRLEALRGIKKEFIEAKTAKGSDGELHDDVALKILSKMANSAGRVPRSIPNRIVPIWQNSSLPKRLLSSRISLSPCRRPNSKRR